MKKTVMVPCIFIYEDAEGRESLCRPSGSCDGICQSCAWNSEEAKQQLVQQYPGLSSVKCIFDDLEGIAPEKEAEAIAEKMLLIPSVQFYCGEGIES